MPEKLKKNKVLIAPLDWGWDPHAVSQSFQDALNNDVEVIIAENENQQIIIKTKFPHCTYILFRRL